MTLGFPSPATIWRLARKVEGLFETQEKQGEALDTLQRGLTALADRVTRLEAREQIVVAEAKGAASTAAIGAASAALVDLARRIGGLEERGRGLGGTTARRLSKDQDELS